MFHSKVGKSAPGFLKTNPFRCISENKPIHKAFIRACAIKKYMLFSAYRMPVAKDRTRIQVGFVCSFEPLWDPGRGTRRAWGSRALLVFFDADWEWCNVIELNYFKIRSIALTSPKYQVLLLEECLWRQRGWGWKLREGRWQLGWAGFKDIQNVAINPLKMIG